MDWQTIETAPKDGSWIELFRPPCEVEGIIRPTHIFAKWFVSEDDCASFCWPADTYEVVSDHGMDDANQAIEDGDCYESTDYWTHWRPISVPAGEA